MLVLHATLKKDDHLMKVAGLALAAVAATASVAWPEDFLEIVPFMGDQRVVVAGLGDIEVVLRFSSVGADPFLWRSSASVNTNSSDLFAAPEFEPATGDLDVLAGVMFSGVADASVFTRLEIEFSETVCDPLIHFWGIDRSRWDFSPSMEVERIDRVSGNAEFVVDGFIVRDRDGDGSVSGDGSIDSALGTARFVGRVSRIEANLSEITDLDDGFRLQVSMSLDRCSCATADLSVPFGILDLSDVNAFTAGFLALDPLSDLNRDGLFDLSDVNEFVNSFVTGCP